MKIFILTLIATLAFTVTLEAKSPTKLTLRAGQQKTAVRGDLTIKFISVVEDSRCPANVQCIWAGNARIKIKVKDRSGASTVMEINTNTGAKGDQFGGYAINLLGLSAEPKGKGSGYTATLSVERLVR